MKIYRVEDAQGYGAYAVFSLWKSAANLAKDRDLPSWRRDQWVSDQWSIPDPHPAPSADGLGRIKDDEHFGFADLKTLKGWMFREPEDGMKMEKLGLLVSVYEVPKRTVRIGGRQCVFRKDGEADRLIESVLPTEFMLRFID